MTKELITIGRTATMSIPDEGLSGIPVKVDTGADGSAIWASDIVMDDNGTLSFCLFAPGSQFYTGKHHQTKEYRVALVRSSHGTLQVRYRVSLAVVIEGRRIRGSFSLAERSQNTYPVLLGCRILNGKFLVDVSLGRPKKDDEDKTGVLTKELKDNPKLFFEKYHLSNQRGDYTR